MKAHHSPLWLVTVTVVSLFFSCSSIHADTLIWDFEGSAEVDDDPTLNRLYDQSGNLKFNLIADRGGTFDRFDDDVPSNPVRYDEMNDENPITDTPGGGDNEWLIRADWSFDGDVHTKHGDGDTGEFVSDPFTVDSTSSFTMDVGGGSDPNGFYLHRASDDEVIISSHRGGGFVQEEEWTSDDLEDAGVDGPTEVYLRIADETTGGWGNVSVDNIVGENVSVAPTSVVWDFEGSVEVEDVPILDRLYDQSGTLKFKLIADSGETFDKFEDGVPSNPVRYDAINDENPINDTPGGDDNDWLIRADWGFDGQDHTKHGDGDTGVFVSDPFTINQKWFFTMDVGGGSLGPGSGFHLHRASDDEILLSTDRGGGFLQEREWTVEDVQAAGVSEPTEVYLRIQDENTGGWGNVSIDNIVGQLDRAPPPPPPSLAWDFEGSAEVDGNPTLNRLYDQSGRLKFNLIADSGETFDKFEDGVPSNPVRYDAINDQNPITKNPITDTPGEGPNEWLVRADWGFDGENHAKHGDGDTGVFVSDAFRVDGTSSFTMDVGGGSLAAGSGLHLHRVADDGIILSTDRGGGFLEKREWTSEQIAGAGVDETTEVYLRIQDENTGGWGNVAVDNIAGFNTSFLPPEEAGMVVWDFEGKLQREEHELENRLYDTTGSIKFHLVHESRDDLPPHAAERVDDGEGDGNTFSRFEDGVPSNPVIYDRINDESPITDTPDGGDNEWLIRADWGLDVENDDQIKHGDSDLGEFISDVFTISEETSFTMDVGGGSDPNGFFLHRASDDEIIISSHRGGGFVQEAEWTSGDLSDAGVNGATAVYLRICDCTTGGWGNVSVDNIVGTNVTFAAPPQIKSFAAEPEWRADAGTVTLTWESIGEPTSIMIDNGVGDVTGMNSVEATIDATTTFTITPSNAEGTGEPKKATAFVNAPPEFTEKPPAEITVVGGRPVTISWMLRFDQSISIDNGIGDVSGKSSVEVSPTQTTTYTVTATNSGGSTSSVVKVNVIQIGPNASGFLVWDFEGGLPIEQNESENRLWDQFGGAKFHLVSPGEEPPGDGSTFDRFEEGVPSNPVQYDAINDERPLENETEFAALVEGDNEWLIRADWSFDGDAHTKHGDGDTGEFISDPFTINSGAATGFTMDVGGGSEPNGFYLHRADDGEVIISEHRGGGFVLPREWTAEELADAGVDGATEVYLRIADETTGGWGNVSVDNIIIGPGVRGPGGGGIFQITGFTAEPAANRVTVTWTSNPGASYAIESGNLDIWEEIEDGIPAAADSDVTTYVDEGLPEGTTEIYYRVRRE